jgi:hypothetical protein
LDALVVVEGDLVLLVVEEGEVAQLRGGELAAGVALVAVVDSGLVLVDQRLDRDGIVGSMDLCAPERRSQHHEEREKEEEKKKKKRRDGQRGGVLN